MHAQKAGDTPGKTFYEYKNSYIMSKIGKKKKELLERKIGGKKSKLGSALHEAPLQGFKTMYM